MLKRCSLGHHRFEVSGPGKVLDAAPDGRLVGDTQDAKDLLGQTLDEEKEADEKLTQVAGQINFEAETDEEHEGSMATAASA